VVGERSVIMVRDADGDIHVVENVCATAACAFAANATASPRTFCALTTSGTTASKASCRVPLRRGVKHQGQVQGGMPSDFRPEAHG
jgi:salicylate 5-hydroxylase large subunit